MKEKTFYLVLFSALMTLVSSCSKTLPESGPEKERPLLPQSLTAAAIPEPETSPRLSPEPEAEPVLPDVRTKPEPELKTEPEAEKGFDPRSVSQALFDSTKKDVQEFIDDLNGIVRRKNYTAWKAALSPGFFAEISSPAYLRRISDSGLMKKRNIILQSPEDYFSNVVVPSRANSRVDDIEFIGKNRVKAYTVIVNRDGQSQRLRLYDLEHTGNSWKIIN